MLVTRIPAVRRCAESRDGPSGEFSRGVSLGHRRFKSIRSRLTECTLGVTDRSGESLDAYSRRSKNIACCRVLFSFGFTELSAP